MAKYRKKPVVIEAFQMTRLQRVVEALEGAIYRMSFDGDALRRTPETCRELNEANATLADARRGMTSE